MKERDPSLLRASPSSGLGVLLLLLPTAAVVLLLYRYGELLPLLLLLHLSDADAASGRYIPDSL